MRQDNMKSSLIPDTIINAKQEQSKLYGTRGQARACPEMKHIIHSSFRNWRIIYNTFWDIAYAVTISQLIFQLAVL